MESTPQDSIWRAAQVTSPNLSAAVPVIIGRDIPYTSNNNSRQTLSIYLPAILENAGLIRRPVRSLPRSKSLSKLPRWQVHIHGGAWRDPFLSAASIEAAVAHAFYEPNNTLLDAIVSINYTLSPFPTQPTVPYDPEKDIHSDSSREAQHPDHFKDVLNAFSFLRKLGLVDGSYILTGHSAGACLALQTALPHPAHYGLPDLQPPPVPAAILGLNGLYDLPNLVHELGASHEHLKGVYEDLISIAFGADQSTWQLASPTRLNVEKLARRAREGLLPGLVALDQSQEDQLVPVNQTESMLAKLREVEGLHVVRVYRLTGRHAAPWEEGNMLWLAVQDVFGLLKEMK